ncbi:12361_t:CDS:2 [Gigaspora margarita]|uniref:12361_t:CDS:1 n=1 Tax=Gigaspora margarita TaxID=4874 RepID=A0ABN7UBS8_GIGMA|nr:12361_t:CDS:2 [Gigaspora margarita]
MKQASSVVSLAGELASKIDNLKVYSTADFDKHEEAAIADELSGTTVVINTIIDKLLRETAEFIEKFLTGNT